MIHNEMFIIYINELVFFNKLLEVFYFILTSDTLEQTLINVIGVFKKKIGIILHYKLPSENICSDLITALLERNEFKKSEKHTVLCITKDSLYWYTSNSNRKLYCLNHLNLISNSISFEQMDGVFEIRPRFKYDTALNAHLSGELKYFPSATNKDCAYTLRLGPSHTEAYINSKVLPHIQETVGINYQYNAQTNEFNGMSIKAFTTFEPNKDFRLIIGPEFVVKVKDDIVSNTFYSNYVFGLHTDMNYSGLGMGVLWNNVEVLSIKLYYEITSWLTIGYTHDTNYYNDGQFYVSIDI